MDKEETLRRLESAYFGEHPHEQAELRQLPMLLEGVDVFVDVGASLGQYTAAANRILSDKQIICLEPDPVRHERLSELVLELEPRGRNHIEVVFGAAFERGGEGEFTTTDSNVSGSIAPGTRVQGRVIKVPYHRLDDLITQRTNVFLKIDVEGSEYNVLRGAPEILASESTRMLLELHAWGESGRYPEHALWLLWRAGLTCRRTAAHHYFTHERSLRGHLAMARTTAGFRFRRFLADRRANRSHGR